MTKAFLAVTMATYDDYDGVWFTVNALRMGNDLSDCAIYILDNKPDAPGSKDMKEQATIQWGVGNLGCHYIEAPELSGTSQTRNAVIAAADCEYFVNLDPHVLMYPGTLDKLKAFFRREDPCDDLIQGPLINDRLVRGRLSTHYADQWRGNMWGIWASAWRSPKGDIVTPFEKHGFVQLMTTEMKPSQYPTPTGIAWAGHEGELLNRGYVPMGSIDEDDFDIPGMGLGMFAARKDSWLGFLPEHTGFGGEEMYIHEKYRRAGRRCRCVGFAPWLHRFIRPRGVPYRLDNMQRARNYYLELLDLGEPIDEFRNHVIGEKYISLGQWNDIESGQYTGVAETSRGPSLEDIYNAFRNQPEGQSYLNKHMDVWRAMAKECEVVQDVTRFPETTVAVLAGKPGLVRSHVFGGSARSPIYDDLLKSASHGSFDLTRAPGPFSGFDIEPCDMLIYKTDHAYHHLANDLRRWAPKVKRWIVLHDTDRNGRKLDDGHAGYLDAIKDFFETDPEWYVRTHTREQCGFTVLGREPDGRPSKPIVLWPPDYGPGTSLKRRLSMVGIQTTARCDCNTKAVQMDLWGIEECEERFEEIVGWLRSGAPRWGWVGNLEQAAAEDATSGPPWTDLTDYCIRSLGRAPQELDPIVLEEATGAFEEYQKNPGAAQPISIGDKAMIGLRAFTSGLAFRVNWKDPFPDLVRLSIEDARRDRAEHEALRAERVAARKLSYADVQPLP